MPTPSETSELLTSLRGRAAAGRWDEVRRALVERGEEVVLAEPELTTLRAEAELRTGHPRQARGWLERALPRLQASGDRAALRKAVNYLGVADVELGALDDATRVFSRALALARIDGDDLLAARATNNLGAISNIRGERAQALSMYQLAIPAYQRLGHTVGLAESFHNMAVTYRHLGQLGLADEYEQRAIMHARDAGNRPLLATGMLGRAEISLLRNDAELAEAGARRAAAEFAALPDPLREADALRVAAAAALRRGGLVDARLAVERAISLSREHGNALNEAEALAVRAQIRAASDARAEARADVRAALEIFSRLGAGVEYEQLAAWEVKVLGDEA
jgi:tetratricopeptide (TPR) repeat protein